MNMEIGSVVQNLNNDRIGLVIAVDADDLQWPIALVQYTEPESEIPFANENAEFVSVNRLVCTEADW